MSTPKPAPPWFGLEFSPRETNAFINITDLATAPLRTWSAMEPVAKKPPKGIQINFRVSKELNAWLKRYAATVGTSKPDLVLQLIESIKESQEKT